ncbi:hypothetical protein K8R03_00025, partial [Candidatus Kaiserbacteria bacterium]|nr:hypothetical protein [Candidatus Kaiserbacteria bacterium]
LQSLNAIGQAIHNISAEKQGAADRVNEIVTQVIRRSESESGDKAKPEKAPYVPSPVRGTSPTTTSPLVQPSVPAVLPTREHREEIAKSVERSLPPVPPAQGEITPPLPLTLDASIEDIQRTIEAQTGQRVDVSPGSRQIAKEITTATQNIGEQQQKLAARDGLELYRDSDHDGVSDYDEKNIYRTNPESAYTAGSPLTDGERILLGLDPLATSTVQVPVESPKVAGEESKSIFEVRSIIRVAPAATTTRALATASTTPETPEKIQISGRGLPNSFVTLYVFSTPVIVTIKTDENGLWTYTLDTPLEDGQHELYVASVNDSGKIIAKSPPVLFTKTAEALDYQPLVIQDISEPTPLDTLRQNFLVTGGVIALIFIGIAVVASGIWRQRPPPALA